MRIWDIVAAVVAGLAVNECCDLSPALARMLVCWSARYHYRDPVRAQQRAEELAAYIDDRPGNLFKLTVAVLFAAMALTARRQASTATGYSRPGYRPMPVTVTYERVPYRDEDAETRRQRMRQMNEALHAVHADIEAASRAVCRRGSPSGRLRRLERVTGDPGWATVAANLTQLYPPDFYFFRYHALVGSGGGGHAPGVAGPWYEMPTGTPTPTMVAAYLAAAQRVREDIRRLGAPTKGVS